MRRGVGRPSKLTEEVRGAFLRALNAGNYVEAAAAMAGLSKQTVYNWLRRAARPGAPADYIEFLDAVEKAQAADEVRDIALISRAAEVHWQAAAWKRERKNPGRWGARVRVTVDQELEAFLDRVETTLAARLQERLGKRYWPELGDVIWETFLEIAAERESSGEVGEVAAEEVRAALPGTTAPADGVDS